MPRSVEAWTGKTDDSAIPPRVRLRVEDILNFAVPEPNSGCWLWERSVQSMGYGCWTFGRKWKLAHRVAYEIGSGLSADGKIICHSCDNPICVNPGHLFAGSQKDNMADCARKGRVRMPNLRGTAHPMAKFTEDDIRAMRRDSRPLREIAETYGTSKTHVSEIKRRLVWGHLE